MIVGHSCSNQANACAVSSAGIMPSSSLTSCKAFNASTDSLEKNMPIPVVITVFSDKSFSFVTKSPPVSFYLKKAIGKEKGSSEPGRVVGGSIKVEQIKEIAENKMKDLNASSIDGAIEMVKGSARSMGLEVLE